MMLDYRCFGGYVLFENMQTAELQAMLDCIGFHTMHYEKGDAITLHGSLLHCIGLIVSGTVHMTKEDVWGDKSIFSVMHEGEILGEEFIEDSPVAASFSYTAASNVYAIFLPFDHIMQPCSKSCPHHQRLSINLVKVIIAKNNHLLVKIDVLSKKSIRKKILAYLSARAQICNSQCFELSMGRLELADYLCVDRSALTRELTRMREEGLIDYEKNTYTLKIDVDASEQI